MPNSRRLLILGGTGEAAELARRLAAEFGGELDVVTSFAGRLPGGGGLPGEVRVGGFGGAGGLCDYLRARSIALLIDATHPFAATISAHARAAAETAGIARLVLARPEWRKRPGDNWIEAEDGADAARELPKIGISVGLFGAAGVLAAFAGIKTIWFLIRLITAPGRLDFDDYHLICARGPYDVEGESRLLAAHKIDVVVTKASGGGATEAKITAAREADIPVLMIRRPAPEAGETVASVADALKWIKNRF